VGCVPGDDPEQTTEMLRDAQPRKRGAGPCHFLWLVRQTGKLVAATDAHCSIPRLTEAVAGNANALDPLAVGAMSFLSDTLRPPHSGAQQIGHLFDSVG
jgi:hypothetical protein